MGLRARVAAALALGSLLVATVLSLLAYQVVRSYLIDQREEFAERQALANARLADSVLRAPDPDVGELLSAFSHDSGSDSLLLVGDRWYGTDVGTVPEGVPAALRRAVDDGAAARTWHRRGGDPLLTIGVALPSADAAYFEAYPVGDLERTLDVLRLALAAGAVGVAAAAAGTGRLVSGRVLKPVRTVATTATAVSAGDLDRRLQADGDADLAPLVDAFNGMVDSLQERIERESRFSSDVSHELRNPLAALTAAAEVLASRRSDIASRSQPAVDVVVRRVQEFDRLLVDLLEISRIDAGNARLELEPVKLGEVVAQAAAAHGRADLAAATGGGGPQVEVDRRRIERIIANLLENAARHAGGATAIAIEERAETVRLVVDDDGPGIADHERALVFNRFYRGGGSRGSGAPAGSGLGLALVAEHVRVHRGRVWVESAPGGGARFVVELPRRPWT